MWSDRGDDSEDVRTLRRLSLLKKRESYYVFIKFIPFSSLENDTIQGLVDNRAKHTE
jgi:hypothetical protein